jgi:Transmembrane secretion effector
VVFATGREPPSSELPASLWRDQSFRLFFFGRTVSMAGTAVRKVVLPILVFQLTGSASQTALLLVFEALPYLLFGLVAAAIADRVNRRTLMIVCNVVSAVAVASMPLASALGMLTLAHIYLVALITATVWVWYDASEFGALPSLVGRTRIVAAGSALSSTFGVVQILAPTVGGALAAVLGAAPVLWVDAVSFVVSAVTLARIPRAFGTPSSRPAGTTTVVRRMAADIVEGLRYVRRHRLIWPLTLAGFGQSLTFGAVLGLLVVYGVRQLDLADDDARLGWLFAAAAVGGLAAAVSLPWLVRRISQPRISVSGLASSVVVMIGLVFVDNLVLALGLLLIFQYTASLVVLNGITLRQRLTPDRLQGRVNVTARMIAWGGQPFGAALGGVIADRLSIGMTYLILTLGVATSAVLAWFSPLRKTDLAMIDRLMRDVE